MLVNGSDCSIVIKTDSMEFDVPYSDETIRDEISILEENASIEGDGICKCIQKKIGIKGCVVTPLTLGTAPLLLYLAMGAVGKPIFISETKNLYKYDLTLVPTEGTRDFELIQDRVNGKVKFISCRVVGFELRIIRDEAVKLKLNIAGCFPAMEYQYKNDLGRDTGERFNGNSVTYLINGQENKNIYGVTFVSKKKGGTKTEIWIKRALQKEKEIPFEIKEMIITAQLLRDKYENRFYGAFRITFKNLVLISDETEIKASGAVMGPLRFYVSGGVSTEVFTSGEEIIP